MSKKINEITTVSAATGDKFIIYDASTNDVGAVAVDGYLSGRYPEWQQANSYVLNETVTKDGGLFKAAGAVAANTAWSVGTGANKWLPLSYALYSPNTYQQIFQTTATDTIIRSPTTSKGYMNITDTQWNAYVDNKIRLEATSSVTRFRGPTGTDAGSTRIEFSDTNITAYRPNVASAVIDVTSSGTIIRGQSGTDADTCRIDIQDSQVYVRRNNIGRFLIDNTTTGLYSPSVDKTRMTFNDTAVRIDYINGAGNGMLSRLAIDSTTTTIYSREQTYSVFCNATNAGLWKDGNNSAVVGASNFIVRANSRQYNFESGGFWSETDNVASLGATGKRWTAVHSTNGTLQTSDQREKTPIEVLPVELLDSWLETVRIGSWNWLEKDNGKHAGFIAQDIIKAFEAVGMNYKEWFTVQEGEDGKLSIVMPEVLAIEAAAQRRRIDKLEAKLNVKED